MDKQQIVMVLKGEKAHVITLDDKRPPLRVEFGTDQVDPDSPGVLVMNTQEPAQTLLLKKGQRAMFGTTYLAVATVTTVGRMYAYVELKATAAVAPSTHQWWLGWVVVTAYNPVRYVLDAEQSGQSQELTLHFEAAQGTGILNEPALCIKLDSETQATIQQGEEAAVAGVRVKLCETHMNFGVVEVEFPHQSETEPVV